MHKCDFQKESSYQLPAGKVKRSVEDDIEAELDKLDAVADEDTYKQLEREANETISKLEAEVRVFDITVRVVQQK